MAIDFSPSLLGETRGDATRSREREKLRAADAAVSKRLAELKENEKREKTRRVFAGIGTPFYEAAVARFDAATVDQLERDALARQTERDRRAAERRARKSSAEP